MRSEAAVCHAILLSQITQTYDLDQVKVCICVIRSKGICVSPSARVFRGSPCVKVDSGVLHRAREAGADEYGRIVDPVEQRWERSCGEKDLASGQRYKKIKNRASYEQTGKLTERRKRPPILPADGYG